MNEATKKVGASETVSSLIRRVLNRTNKQMIDEPRIGHRETQPIQGESADYSGRDC
jgi:hypothetical protein